MITIDEIKKAALPLCREFNVYRLDIFGSTASGTARISSDVDFLVEFKDPNQSPAKRFFGLLHSLEDTLGCEVDLLTINGLKNPYFKHRVLAERVLIYEG
jgi:predicted nucleotidyltransferase